MRQKVLRLVLLVGFAANGIACGQINVPMTLALEEGSFIGITVPAGSPNPPGIVDLEGGVETSMSLEFSLLDFLFKRAVSGDIVIDDLLFAGTSFVIVGIPTGTVCTIPDPDNPGAGMAVIDIFKGEIGFAMELGTLIKVSNPVLAGLIPDGFPLSLVVSDSAELSLVELIALAFGNADGGLTVTQELMDVIEVVILGIPLSIGLEGELTLSTVNEFPTGVLLDECIDLLGL